MKLATYDSTLKPEKCCAMRIEAENKRPQTNCLWNVWQKQKVLLKVDKQTAAWWHDILSNRSIQLLSIIMCVQSLKVH